MYAIILITGFLSLHRRLFQVKCIEFREQSGGIHEGFELSFNSAYNDGLSSGTSWHNGSRLRNLLHCLYCLTQRATHRASHPSQQPHLQSHAIIPSSTVKHPFHPTPEHSPLSPHFFSSASPFSTTGSSLLKFKLTLLTQCRSSIGVG